MLHVPYQGEGRIASKNMRDYVVKQLKEEVIPALERVTGVKFDIDRLRQYIDESAKAEEDLVAVLESAKRQPSPIDGYFGGVYYIGPDLHRLPRHRGSDRVLPRAARRRSSSACARARGRSRPTAR